MSKKKVISAGSSDSNIQEFAMRSHNFSKFSEQPVRTLCLFLGTNMNLPL